MTHPAANDSLSQFPESFWRTYPVPHFPQLLEDSKTDIAVIGGGIVGILTAYLLTKAGKQVTLIEANNFLSGVTGHTTAKISAQHGLIYDELVRTFSKEHAKLYYKANLEGLDLIQAIVEDEGIDCDFEEKTAVVYATTAKGALQIKKEARAYKELGINGELIKGQVEGLPFDTNAALTMPRQAQCHPVKFLAPLLVEIQRLGGKLYQQTRAMKLKGDSTIVLENGKHLDFNKVVVASHYPFNDFNGFYFSKLSISRSYALAAKVNGPIPQDMYISAESPTRSLRTILADTGERLLLIGGDDHPTGKSKNDTQEHYENLEQFGRDYFPLEETLFHWSAQDMTTLDKVPYIGQMTTASANILVATGFNKWGMAMGASAAKLLVDLVTGELNAYADFFDPTRGKFKAKDIQQFSIKNVSVAKDLVVTKAKRPDMSPEELGFDEGGLVSVEGKKVGGYRDQNGELHLVKTTCTHMGCGLNWNDAERSWDCPCHGSRFAYSGEVLNGPAVKPLKKM